MEQFQHQNCTHHYVDRVITIVSLSCDRTTFKVTKVWQRNCKKKDFTETEGKSDCLSHKKNKTKQN